MADENLYRSVFKTNEGKSVVAGRFIWTSKNKIYKYMRSISKNMYINKLDDIVNKCNNTYHNTIKVKPVDVKIQAYILISVKIMIKKVLNLKLVIMLKYQNIKILLRKTTFQISLKKFFVIKKVKNTVPWTYVISDLNGEKIVGTFY